MSHQWRVSLYNYGHHPEGRVTFRRGIPHIVWKDPRTDHRTSLETISNVP